MKIALTSLYMQLAGEIRAWALLKALILLLPFGALSMITHDLLWIQVSLLTITTMIVDDRLQLTPLGVLLYGISVITSVYLLLFSQLIPALFITTCMLLAAAVIWIAAQGKRLRTFGNWTFIPTLILANELHGNHSATTIFHQASASLPYLFIALAPTFAMAVFKYDRHSKTASKADKKGWRWFSNLQDFGPKAAYGESMAAMVIGVGLAALLVEYYPLQHGPWVIWGVASVVTGTVDTAVAKLRSRAIGVFIGVPFGIMLGQFVIPHSQTSITLATIATFLTLVAFHKYIIAYCLRCTFVALTIMLANQSATAAFERLTHVLLGGIIGILCVLICYYVAHKNTD